jgi:hypothetical protein
VQAKRELTGNFEESSNVGADRPGGRKTSLEWSAAVHVDRVWMQAQKDTLRLDEVHRG